MRLVIISDTHGHHDKVIVPDGDVLIHCGDATRDAGQADLRRFLAWCEANPHKNKILIAGNHDWAFEKWPDLARQMVKDVAPSATYLEDSGVEIDGIKFWGSPFQPEFCGWAFNVDRGPKLKVHWDKIPKDTDVLITHCPPYRRLDKTYSVEHVGCKDLLDAVKRIEPEVHCFGHIHYSYGNMKEVWRDAGDHEGPLEVWTTFVNAAICGEDYKPTNKPWVVEI